MRIYTRSAWTSRSPKNRISLDFDNVKFIVAHWPGSKGNLDPKKTAAYLRGWQAYHMDTRGWTDIAYNEAIDLNGDVWICRGAYKDGATSGYGGRSYSILLVLGQKDTPTEAMLAALKTRSELHRKQSASSCKVVGHRDLVKTDCPGDKIYNWLKGSTPPAPTPPVPKPLTVNGKLDSTTIKRWQEVMGTPEDGKISNPYSNLVAAVQKALNKAKVRDWEGKALKVDGDGIQLNLEGRYPQRGRTRTIWALQKYLGIKPDGYLSPVSDTIKELQRRLNTGKF